VAGGGFPGVHGGAAGDAIFSISVVCGADFTREGLNLSGELQVDFVTATLGGSVEAKVLGRDLRITILPNSQQGCVIRLPARGLSDKAGNQGDLRLRIALVMPSAATLLTDEQRHAFQEMFADAARRGAPDSSDS
jgi:molecular chaperone DnaJ